MASEAYNNPMLMDVILSNMFGYCDFEDLTQCRRVSKLWFKESLPTWLAKAPTRELSLDPQAASIFANDCPDISTTMSAFLGQIHDEFHSYGPFEYFGLRQYQKFRVEGESWDDVAYPVQHFCLQQFYRITGQFLTELQLELSIFDVDTYRVVVLSSMTPNLVKLVAKLDFDSDCANNHNNDELMMGEDDCQRKLTCLEIGNSRFSGQGFSNLALSGWTQLLKRYPNLKTLVFYPDYNELEAVNRMLEAIGNIRKADKKRLDLRRLEIYHEDWKHPVISASLFRDAQLTLATLEMSFGNHTPSQAIYDVLASQAATLKKLCIHRKEALDITFAPPEMPFVQSLNLCGAPFQSLTPLENFPNLKSLHLNYSASEELTLSDPLSSMLSSTEKGLVMPSVTTLHADYDSAKIVTDSLGQEHVRQLAGLFPKLKDLQLWLNNESLRTVVQSWPDLNHLTIIGNGVDDDGIAGAVSHLPTTMHDLKSLTMKHCDPTYKGDMGPTAITEKSLVKFLALLPNLECLEVTLNAQLNVDSEVLGKVKGKIKTFKLTRARKQGEQSDTEDEDQESDHDDGSRSRSKSASDGEMG